MSENTANKTSEDNITKEKAEELVNVRPEIYIGTQLIRARKMTKFDYATYISGEKLSANVEDMEGYYLVTGIGEQRWVSASTFEKTYREVTNQEKGLLGG